MQRNKKQPEQPEENKVKVEVRPTLHWRILKAAGEQNYYSIGLFIEGLQYPRQGESGALWHFQSEARFGTRGDAQWYLAEAMKLLGGDVKSFVPKPVNQDSKQEEKKDEPEEGEGTEEK